MSNTYTYFPEDRHNFLTPCDEDRKKHRDNGFWGEDVIDILSEELNHIQSLFGIDTHLTMARW